jgi:hypothetical protein
VKRSSLFLTRSKLQPKSFVKFVTISCTDSKDLIGEKNQIRVKEAKANK